MCPFIDEDNFLDDSPYDHKENNSVHKNAISSYLLQEDKRFFVIGAAVSVIVFFIAIYMIYSNSKPVDLEELPVISADNTPIKVKPDHNDAVKHQDKVIYDNVSGNERKAPEHIVELPKNINNVEEELSDSEEEEASSLRSKTTANNTPSMKQELDDNNDEVEAKNIKEKNYEKILKNSEAATPEKPIAAVKKSTNSVAKTSSESIFVQENEREAQERDEQLDLEQNEDSAASESHEDTVAQKKRAQIRAKKEKNKLAAEKLSVRKRIAKSRTGSVMIQAGLLKTKIGAEKEYNRLVKKNDCLQGTGKKVVKVDLGKPRGVMYRLQIGPFKTKSDAKKVVATLKKRGFVTHLAKQL